MFSDKPALVLNADFRPLSMFPLSIWNWEETIKAVVKKTVTVVAEHSVAARSPSTSILLPSVVALREYQPFGNRVAFTRYNVFLRDHFTCQYCGDPFKPKHLTFDHVIPRCRGGATDWENIVSACESCNTQKDDQDLQPLKAPKVPTIRELAAAQRLFPPNYLHESWLDFLYWDAELET